MSEDKLTTIKLKSATRAKLADFGKKSETFDQIVMRLLNEVEDYRMKEGKIGDQSRFEQAALTA